MSDVTAVREAVADVLADRCTPAVLEAAERDGWAAEVWDPLHAGGFTTVGVPEDAGGAGGSVAEACAILEEVGAASAPVPLAETGLLAGRLLASADLALPDGAADHGRRHRRPAATGRCPGAWGGWPGRGGRDRIVAARRRPRRRRRRRRRRPGRGVDHARAATSPASPATPSTSTASCPEATAPAPPDARDALARRGALARAALIAGAAHRVRDLTVAYTGERVQFGRPVSRFPAVADHLVRIAEQAEMASMAARAAAVGAGEHGEPAALDVAAASTVASEAAGLVAAAAHQATGAMGVTREFALGVLTRRLWSWRDEWGGERAWATALGRRLAAGGPDALWPTLSRGVGTAC